MPVGSTYPRGHGAMKARLVEADPESVMVDVFATVITRDDEAEAVDPQQREKQPSRRPIVSRAHRPPESEHDQELAAAHSPDHMRGDGVLSATAQSGVVDGAEPGGERQQPAGAPQDSGSNFPPRAAIRARDALSPVERRPGMKLPRSPRPVENGRTWGATPGCSWSWSLRLMFNHFHLRMIDVPISWCQPPNRSTHGQCAPTPSDHRLPAGSEELMEKSRYDRRWRDQNADSSGLMIFSIVRHAPACEICLVG